MAFKICFLIIIALTGCAVFKKDPTSGNPPGTLKINDTLFIDETEVTNISWREYLYYLSDVEKDEDRYQKALPDTLVWRSLLRYCEPVVEYYFRHPAFNSYPAVGISYEQVIEFCKWRTYVANQGIYFRENKIEDRKAHQKDKFPFKFYYRLPTKEEWEIIAAGKFIDEDHPFGDLKSYTIWNGKQVKSFNCLYPNEMNNFNNEQALYTASGKSYFKNVYGCYNLIGNVAEMSSEKGVAKGGSFIHPLDSCKISIDQNYSKPEMWLGFRCVAVKLK